MEDIRGESEAERVTRMEDLDTASLFRLEERVESVDVPSSIVMSELVAQGEYWERREEFREKRRADMRERLERLRDSIRSDEEYIVEYDRTHTHVEDILPKGKEYKERERYLVRVREKRDDLEQNFETRLEESVQNFNNSVDYLLLREEFAPRDFTTRW